MQLVDPTGEAPEQNNKRSLGLDSLDGKVVGLLSNGKLNADLLLRETAQLFEDKHGCSTLELTYKPNPSGPAPIETLQQLAQSCNFLLTATGD